MSKPATEPNNLEKFFVERVNAGDLDGLVSLYEENAVISYAQGKVAIGQHQIREFFVQYLASNPKLDSGNQSEALCSGELALTSSRLANGDVTAEIARQQEDGNWLWVVDQFAVGKNEA